MRMDNDKTMIWLGYAASAMFTWMGVVDLVRGKWISGVLFLASVAIILLGLWLRDRQEGGL